jgi:hypothetical protein
MRRIMIVPLALLLIAAVAWGRDDKKDPPDAGKSATPAGQFEALKKEYDTAFQERQKALEKYQSFNQQMQSIARRVMEFADKNSKDPAAFDALVWVTTANALDFQLRQRAAGALTKNHAESEKIGGVLAALLQMPDGEKNVRSIMEKNTNRNVQGEARLALGSHLKQMAVRARSETDKERQTKEAEQLLQEAVDKFADVKTAQGTVGEAAKSHLEALKAMANLAVGKTVPEIDGPDLDGKEFKLSDYRGKVVMLDFWGHW